jgi:hypothetical protein
MGINVQASVGADVKGPQSTWLCLDLIETLIRLADAGHSDLVDKILEVPKKICPGLLLMGLASVCISQGWKCLIEYS